MRTYSFTLCALWCSKCVMTVGNTDVKSREGYCEYFSFNSSLAFVRRYSKSLQNPIR